MQRSIGYKVLIQVTVDESKFTDEFMEEFRRHFYPFNTIEEHMEHLAQLEARGLIGVDNFVEGYGDIREFGVKFGVGSGETEIVDI